MVTRLCEDKAGGPWHSLLVPFKEVPADSGIGKPNRRPAHLHQPQEEAPGSHVCLDHRGDRARAGVGKKTAPPWGFETSAWHQWLCLGGAPGDQMQAAGDVPTMLRHHPHVRLHTHGEEEGGLARSRPQSLFCARVFSFKGGAAE
jgi:hypothetical protein